MTEGMPPTYEQTRQLHRSMTEKILDRAASDPEWKQQLLDDPEAAIRAANFPEAQQLEQVRAGAGEGEVRGQARPGTSGGGATTPPQGCPLQCTYWTIYWELPWRSMLWT